MSRLFGWSYPPGCSGTPYDQDDGVTGLQDAVLGLLEEAGIDTETNDAIINLVRAGEQKMWAMEAEGDGPRRRVNLAYGKSKPESACKPLNQPDNPES